jgi:hypothetical protein
LLHGIQKGPLRPTFRTISAPRTPASWVLRASCRSARTRATGPAARRTGSRARTQPRQRCGGRPRKIGGGDCRCRRGGPFPVGWRRDRQLLERRPAGPRSGDVIIPYKVADRRTPAQEMRRRPSRPAEMAAETPSASRCLRQANRLREAFRLMPGSRPWFRLRPQEARWRVADAYPTQVRQTRPSGLPTWP